MFLVRIFFAFFLALSFQPRFVAQDSSAPIQPFTAHVRALEVALDYLGQPLSNAEQQKINEATGMADEAKVIADIEKVLDPYVLCLVDINAEGRVKVEPGAARPELVEGGTRIFLVKVHNRAHTADRSAARKAYDNAREVYRALIAESDPNE